MIETLEERFRVPMAHRFRSLDAARQHVPPHLWPFFLHPPRGQMFVPPAGHALEPSAQARVSRSRWIANCPMPGCNSRQHVSKDDHLFFCAHCLNEAVGNRTVPVEWPRDVDGIERVLLVRPFAGNRNWHPGETIADLERENREHGLGA